MRPFFLFGLIRVMRIRRVPPKSAACPATARPTSATLLAEHGAALQRSISTPVPKVGANHLPIIMDATTITPESIGSEPLDLIFLDYATIMRSR